MLWEGDYVRLVLAPKDSKGLSKELVSPVSSSLRKIGCRCVLDDEIRGKVRSKPMHVELVVHIAVSLLVVCVVVRILVTCILM